eukprot:394869-Prorocentrum_minimum.AAC.1
MYAYHNRVTLSDTMRAPVSDVTRAGDVTRGQVAGGEHGGPPVDPQSVLERCREAVHLSCTRVRADSPAVL